MVYPVNPTDFTTQTATEYKAAIDEAIAGLADVVNSFAPRALEPEGMGLLVGAGVARSGAIIGPWEVADIGAPSEEPRIDVIYYEPNARTVHRITGEESADPTAPSMPLGSMPIAQIHMTPNISAIYNEDILDIRPVFSALPLFAEDGYTYMVDPDGLYRAIIGRSGIDERIIFDMHSSGSFIVRNSSGSYVLEVTSEGEAKINGNEIWHEGNTTVDTNGFIREASPVVRVFSDRVEPRGHPDVKEAKFKKIGIGLYRIAGTPSLAKTGWRIVAPRDQNGNLTRYVEVLEEEGGVLLSCFSPQYEGLRVLPGAPLDLPKNRWVDLRFNEHN